ncbi:MAG: hypothetical protein R6V01_02320 [Thermoplasmatota archaeon]
MDNKGRIMDIIITIALISVTIMPIIASGSEAKIESGWGMAIAIDDSEERVQNTDLAMDPSGNAIAVWQQYDGTIYNIWSNRYVAGTGWGTPILIENNDAGFAFAPNIVVNPSGNAIVVWAQNDGTKYNVWSNRYNAGIGWGIAEQIETSNGIDPYSSPRIAVDSSGNAIAIWRQYDGTIYNIWSNRYVPETGWGTPVQIETQDEGSASSPSIAMNASGNAMVLWYQSDGTRTNIWSSQYVPGSGWSTAELIETDNAGNAIHPQIAFDNSGNAIAVWSQSDGTSYNAWSNRYVAGMGWGTAELIETDNTGSARLTRIAIDGSGNAVSVWELSRGARYDIWSNRYVVGTGWGTAELIETNDEGSARFPKVDVDPSGNAIAVWRQSDGTTGSVWSNRYVPETGWGTAGSIEDESAGSMSSTKIAMDASGNAIAVWSKSDGNRNRIWMNRFIAPDTTPPSLSVSSPVDGSETDLPVATVKGTTEPGAILTINGLLVEVRSDGSFSCNISLIRGRNDIMVTSKDDRNNIVTVSKQVTYNDPVSFIIQNLTILLERVELLESEMNLTAEMIESIEVDLKNITERFDSLGPDLDERFGSLEGEIELKAGEIVSLRENLTRIESGLDFLNNDMDLIKDNLTSMGSDLDSAGTDVEEIENAVALMDEALKGFEVKVSSLSTDLDSLEADQESANDLRSDLESTNNSLDSVREELDFVRALNTVLIVVLIIVVIVMVLLILMMFKISSKRDDYLME